MVKVKVKVMVSVEVMVMVLSAKIRFPENLVKIRKAGASENVCVWSGVERKAWGEKFVPGWWWWWWWVEDVETKVQLKAEQQFNAKFNFRLYILLCNDFQSST